MLEENLLEVAIKLEDLDPKLAEQEAELEKTGSRKGTGTDYSIPKANYFGDTKLEKHFKKSFENAPRAIQQFYERCQKNGLHRPITPVVDKTCGVVTFDFNPNL